MKTNSKKPEASRRNPCRVQRLTAAAALLLPWWAATRADDFTAQFADRMAIERVYHAHRTGTKPPFEQAMPRELIEQLTRQDQHKETVLGKVYGFEIIPAMVETEVQRIDATTRASEMLAEIKQALGGDPARFARAMARPIVVERELRRRFDNDDARHAARRREAEQAREKLLAEQPVAGMQEVTWQLTPRPEEISAEALAAASLSIPKRSYEEWLAQQPEP